MSNSYSTGHSSPGNQPSHLTGPDVLGLVENAVRENPLSAALIGMGALWLFMGGSSISLFGNGQRRSVFGALQQGAEATAHAVQSGVSAAGCSVSHAASSVTHAARQIGDAAAQTVQGAAASAGDIASRSADAVTTAAQKLERKGEKWGGALQQNIETLFTQQPLTLGIVGIAIGAGIAVSLPTTEAEQTLMGEASDLVQNQLSGVAGQVKELASSAVEDIKGRL